MIKKILVLVSIFSFSIFLSISKGDSGSKGEYVGMDTCIQCHEDLGNNFKKTPHGKPKFEMLSDKGCETCHGPGELHAKREGDKTKIIRIQTLTPEERNNICLKCHEKGNRIYWKGSIHETRNISCTDCHSVHNSKSEDRLLVKNSQTEVCGKCHKDVKGKLMRASHHPIREGKMKCTDCHNPHGSITPNLISANSINEKCYECHAEKRGPFLWEHPPARDNCDNCHEPHGSNHEKLLVAKNPFLCQRCHSNRKHRGRLYDGKPSSFSRFVFNRSCLNCHPLIHGSNSPAGTYFGR
jgi:DmsE family decaheme c-type cytochrome